MTTNSELYELAKKHSEDKYMIAYMITAIDEAKGQQNATWNCILSCIETCDYAKKQEKYYTATNNSISQYAIEHDKATAKLQTLFYTLACQLEALGENISY